MKRKKEDIVFHTDSARSIQEVSLDDIRDMLWAAIREKGDYFYVTEVYPSYLVYSDDKAAKHYKVSWSIIDGAVTLGKEIIEVESNWIEVNSKQAESDEGIDILMRLGEVLDKEGLAWDVTICQPGFTKNGWYIPDEALRDAEALFEGVDVNLYELPTAGATHVPTPLFDLKSLLVKNKVGWIDNVKHVAGLGLIGVLHFLDSAKWLGKNLLAAKQSGGDIYGLSYDCPVRAKQDIVDGKSVFKIGKFLAADSVDIVTRPAAGGKFNRAVASVPAPKKEANAMKKSLWDLIAKVRPVLLQGKVFDTISDQEVEALARMALENQGQEGGDDSKKEIAILRCEMELKDKLSASDLPPIAKERIQHTFAGTVFKVEDLDRAIAGEKDYLAKLNPQPQDVVIVPASGLYVGLSSYERACMAIDKLFGLTKDDMTTFFAMRRLDNQQVFADIRNVQDYADYDNVPTFNGIRDMYTFFTGDKEVSGRFIPSNIPKDVRSRMDITSATFSYLLGNTLNRRMVKDYLEANFSEKKLISIRKTVKDFRTQEAVMVGGFPDLEAVDPETADYNEIAGVTDEEASYTVAQKGNILTFTRKTILNDDISIVQRLVSRLGRAARRTHAKYIWNFFINNGTCSDGTSWFTSPHGNLGSAALSFANALTMYMALGKMTEKDSGERLGLLSDPSVKPTLVYPIDLIALGESIVNDDDYYTSNDLTTKTRNSLKGKIEGYCCPLLTDATDWGMLLPPEVIDMIEMGYLNGREEPEMFVADSPQGEQVFVADKIRYKIRHEYAGTVIDYRSGGKNVVAG